MPDIRRFVRENRWTLLMLLFLMGLYGALFVSGMSSQNVAAPASAADEDAVTAAQIREKEEAALARLEEKPELMAALSLSFLAALAAGLAIDLYLLIRRLRGRPWFGPPGERTAPRWGLRDLVRTFIFLFFVEGAIFVGQMFWYWATGLERTGHDLFLMASSLTRDLAVAGFVVWLVRTRGQSLRELGFRTRGFWRNVRTGLVGYVAMVPPMLLSFALLAVLLRLFSYEPLPQNVVQIYLKKETAPYLFAFTAFVAVLGPVFEELFFRGFAYAAVRRRFGAPRATLLTAAAFAAFHVNLVAFLPIFLLGCFLTYLYEATGSLVPCITAHVLHNTLMVLMTLGFRSLAGAM